jgi:hypothetical protein
MKHGRAPQHGEDRDIFERLYAVRLDRLRALGRLPDASAPFDHQGFARGRRNAPLPMPADDMDTDALLAELEGAIGRRPTSPIFAMCARPRKSAPPRRSPTAKNAKTSRRSSPLFEQVQRDLEDSGFARPDKS